MHLGEDTKQTEHLGLRILCQLRAARAAIEDSSFDLASVRALQAHLVQMKRELKRKRQQGNLRKGAKRPIVGVFTRPSFCFACILF